MGLASSARVGGGLNSHFTVREKFRSALFDDLNPNMLVSADFRRAFCDLGLMLFEIGRLSLIGVLQRTSFWEVHRRLQSIVATCIVVSVYWFACLAAVVALNGALQMVNPAVVVRPELTLKCDSNCAHYTLTSQRPLAKR